MSICAECATKAVDAGRVFLTVGVAVCLQLVKGSGQNLATCGLLDRGISHMLL